MGHTNQPLFRSDYPASSRALVAYQTFPCVSTTWGNIFCPSLPSASISSSSSLTSSAQIGRVCVYIISNTLVYMFISGGFHQEGRIESNFVIFLTRPCRAGPWTGYRNVRVQCSELCTVYCAENGSQPTALPRKHGALAKYTAR
jgi:hypothetical protein